MCHYFGVGWVELNRLPFSEFTRLAKCSKMLSSRERLIDIKINNFSQMRDDTKRQFHSELVSASSEFIERKVKDYKEVLANIARTMSGRR